ncbi:MAG: GNAT family N-acetyltransferase [Rickettsiales bacterium]|jgi:ribosomal protein S18 acetylase RimI-like enzyme|nr:GNAT family N-acetyltransferase [Rickettsiales bacterium]
MLEKTATENQKITFTKLKFIEFSSVKEMESVFFLINQSQPKLDINSYKVMLNEMISKNNYKMVSISYDKKIIAVAGYFVMTMLYCGRYLQISNLVVDKNFRSLGVGEKILKYFDEKALKINCNKIVLDSYIENKKSHNLYYRLGFYVRGFHFMKDITPFAMNY